MRIGGPLRRGGSTDSSANVVAERFRKGPSRRIDQSGLAPGQQAGKVGATQLGDDDGAPERVQVKGDGRRYSGAGVENRHVGVLQLLAERTIHEKGDLLVTTEHAVRDRLGDIPRQLRLKADVSGAEHGCRHRHDHTFRAQHSLFRTNAHRVTRPVDAGDGRGQVGLEAGTKPANEGAEPVPDGVIATIVVRARVIQRRKLLGRRAAYQPQYVVENGIPALGSGTWDDTRRRNVQAIGTRFGDPQQRCLYRVIQSRAFLRAEPRTCLHISLAVERERGVVRKAVFVREGHERIARRAVQPVATPVPREAGERLRVCPGTPAEARLCLEQAIPRSSLVQHTTGADPRDSGTDHDDVVFGVHSSSRAQSSGIRPGRTRQAGRGFAQE